MSPPALRLCRQTNFLDSSSAQNTWSPPPRSPNSAFCPPLLHIVFAKPVWKLSVIVTSQIWRQDLWILEIINYCRVKNLIQWFPSFLDAFPPLLILEIYIPHLRNYHSLPVRVRRRVLTTTGTMVFGDNNNLINKSETKTIWCQIMALTFANKNVW